jgi:hypothetical protein
MLGKTNISTLSEGAIVTEIEDFKWIQIQSGIYGNFVKAVCKNGYLAAITADGTVVYTTDGEVWQTSVLEYEDCKLNDIYWDGSRFILVGSYSYTDTNLDATYQRGLILTTEDFAVYDKVEIPGGYSVENDGRGNWITEYLGIYAENSKYLVLGIEKIKSNTNGTLKETIYLYRYVGNLVNEWEKLQVHYFEKLNSLLSVANNSNKFMISYSGTVKNGSYTSALNEIGIITNDERKVIETGKQSGNLLTPVFECKNELYYMRLYSSENYVLSKVIDSDEKIVLSQGINYGFVDGIYFNNCQLFINNHEMMVVKKGESLANKTLDDLIEIAPELTMNCITKAFGQLYIFGNQGAILKSSVETNNENAIAVQTLSAKKALADAKAYSDEKYAQLEARIIALESSLVQK